METHSPLLMKDITPILSSLGLLDSEIKVYMAGLEHGANTIQDYAKKTRLSRQAVYTAIDMLTKRGLFSSSTRAKKRYFAAEHPEKLLAYAKRFNNEMQEKIGDLEHVLPQLTLQMGGDRPIVKVFEGKEGLKAIIEDMRKTHHNEILEITDSDAMYTVLTPEDLRSMRRELKKQNVRVRGLYSGKEGERILEVSDMTLPKELSHFKADVGVYGDTIRLVTFEGKMYSVLIESKILARTLTILFELAFKGMKQSK